MESYCAKHNLKEDFRTFLFHGKNDVCSKTYRFLYGCPKIYLVNSKAFREYYETLDCDFKRDIIDEEDINRVLLWLKRNKKLKKFLKKVMGKDSVL